MQISLYFSPEIYFGNILLCCNNFHGNRDWTVSTQFVALVTRANRRCNRFSAETLDDSHRIVASNWLAGELSWDAIAREQIRGTSWLLVSHDSASPGRYLGWTARRNNVQLRGRTLATPVRPPWSRLICCSPAIKEVCKKAGEAQWHTELLASLEIVNWLAPSDWICAN